VEQMGGPDAGSFQLGTVSVSAQFRRTSSAQYPHCDTDHTLVNIPAG
jgi:hypothetical protein